MKNYMTRAKHDLLCKEYEALQKERRILGKEAGAAADIGDAFENAELESVRDKQILTMSRMAKLQEWLSNVSFIDTLPISPDRCSLGTEVVIRFENGTPEERYHILGPADADADDHVISYQSPLAQALISKRVGDAVTLPGRNRSGNIVSIRRSPKLGTQS